MIANPEKSEQAQSIENGDRLAAYALASSVLNIFERSFVDDMRPRMSLPVSIDYARGIISHDRLEWARQIVQSAIDDAAITASRADSTSAWELHSAIMALQVIAISLDEHVDIVEAQRFADEALRHSSFVGSVQ